MWVCARRILNIGGVQWVLLGKWSTVLMESTSVDPEPEIMSAPSELVPDSSPSPNLTVFEWPRRLLQHVFHFNNDLRILQMSFVVNNQVMYKDCHHEVNNPLTIH